MGKTGHESITGVHDTLRPALTVMLVLVVTASLALGCKPQIASKQSPKQPAQSQSGSTTRTPTDTVLPTATGRAFHSDSSSLKATRQQWPTEAFAEAASERLSQLKNSIKAGKSVNAPAIQQIFASEFQATLPKSFAPSSKQVAGVRILRYTADSLSDVEQSGGEAPASESNDRTLSRSPSITRFLATLAHTGGDRAGKPSYLKAKIISVRLVESIAKTTLRIEAHWTAGANRGQTTSTWHADWSSESDAPQIQRAELLSLETVQSSDESSWFVDATAAAIGDPEASEQLSHGLHHWLSRIETAHGMNYFSKHGLSVADVNGDGFDDLYVCQPGGLPNRLLIQLPDGTTADRTAEFGLDLLDRTSSAVFVDLDNDGDQDVAMATLMGVLIYENIKNERFEKRQQLVLADTDLQGISAVDYDNDGDLDLYQVVDFASTTSRVQQGLPLFVYHDAKDGGANRLFENQLRNTSGAANGRFQFQDVTERVGLDKNNRRHSLAAAWNDFDNDGDQDLYVANDYGPNSLFQNISGRFVDIADATRSKDFGSGMSVAWGDYDRDGRSDLYVANMFSSAGRRIPTQTQFLPHAASDSRRIYERFAKGNTLLRGGETEFEDRTSQAGVGMGRWSWSSQFADINNDGWQDLLVSNGYITTNDNGDL